MNKTKIDWADYAWNPVTGCSKVSEGCRNCYAERHAKRFWGERKFSDVICHEDRLNQPRTIKKPSLIFVNSMSDLFHKDVPTRFIDKVLFECVNNPLHSFIILTKRAERMRDYFLNECPTSLSLDNLILGVSVEDQETADKRIPILLNTRAMHRVISIEPMIGEIKLFRKGSSQFFMLDWVIVGGESGPGARPMKLEWATAIQKDCQYFRVPFFFKQWGEYDQFGERVGKAAAGHLLDGLEYLEYPKCVVSDGEQ